MLSYQYILSKFFNLLLLYYIFTFIYLFLIVTLVMWSLQKNRARESRDGVLTLQILNMVLVVFLTLFNLQNKHSEDNDPIMLTLGKTNKPLFHIDHILGNALLCIKLFLEGRIIHVQRIPVYKKSI